MSQATQLALCGYVTLALVLHIQLLSCQEASWSAAAICLLSAFVNTVLGGFGHNGCHRLEVAGALLDWNGLSAYEWLHEHCHSHHMYVNSNLDHDAVSMRPFNNWSPSSKSSLLSSTGIHVIYLFGQLVVAISSNLGHRLRWKPFGDPDAPMWLRLAPFLFWIRIASHFVFQPGWFALLSSVVCVATSGYYFAYLAHLNHANPTVSDFNDSGCDSGADFLEQQMAHTVDIKLPPFCAHLMMFLDRQTLHHAFPGVDHSRLPAARHILPEGRVLSLPVLAGRHALTLERFCGATKTGKTGKDDHVPLKTGKKPVMDSVNLVTNLITNGFSRINPMSRMCGMNAMNSHHD